MTSSKPRIVVYGTDQLGQHETRMVDGNPSSSIRVEREDSGYATAACIFNSIQDVTSAEPGIKLVSELGPIKTTALC